MPKFIPDLKSLHEKQKKPVVIYFVANPDNKEQCGDYISSFVDLINNNKQHISKLIIVDGSYLNRHYYSKKDSGYSDYNDGTIFAWRNIHMSRLINLKVNYSIKGWHEIVEKEDFVQYRNTIDDLMQDKNFSDIAYMVAERHKKKSNGNVSVCLDYLKEECAFVLSLADCIFTYPGKLNEAILWLLDKSYNKKIAFTEYSPSKKHSARKITEEPAVTVNKPVDSTINTDILAQQIAQQVFLKLCNIILEKQENSKAEGKNDSLLEKTFFTNTCFSNYISKYNEQFQSSYCNKNEKRTPVKQPYFYNGTLVFNKKQNLIEKQERNFNDELQDLSHRVRRL